MYGYDMVLHRVCMASACVSLASRPQDSHIWRAGDANFHLTFDKLSGPLPSPHCPDYVARVP
jgi:hypothetical protein